MKDLQAINQAVYDALQEHAPGTNYIMVLWQGQDRRACISSNVIDEQVVQRMLAGATQVVANTDPRDLVMVDIGTVGHA
jgi:hypothetical protein